MKMLITLVLVLSLTACGTTRVYPLTYQQERADWSAKQADTIRNANAATGRL